MKKIAMIGDIVQSRNINDRAGAQAALKKVLMELNETPSNLLSPYTITLGDEFQCLKEKADGAFHDILQILVAMHPQKIRFSLGIGELVTDVNPEMAIGMDGPVFHNARDGMEALKNSQSLITIRGITNVSAQLANHALALVSRNFQKWNKRQLEIMRAMLGTDATMSEVAENLGITKQAVSQAVRLHGIKDIAGMLIATEQIINANL